MSTSIILENDQQKNRLSFLNIQEAPTPRDVRSSSRKAEEEQSTINQSDRENKSDEFL